MDSATPPENWGEGNLWSQVLAQTQYALQTGALQPIETSCEVIQQVSLEFLVRISSSLNRKAQAQAQPAGAAFNPFLPYDPDLFVADLSQTHLCLLNKYNVTPHHLLIITRAFEPQATLLSLPDFAALWLCMNQLEQQKIESLGFYNSGKQAGASQPHRHLQIVPLPLAPSHRLPIQAALEKLEPLSGNGAATVWQSPMLPFGHAIVRLSATPTATDAHTAYLLLLSQLGLNQPEPPPYNLLVTRQWMLVVPRRQEQFGSIPVNALGFAGSLFVRDLAQLAQLKQLKPLQLLAEVATKPACNLP